MLTNNKKLAKTSGRPGKTQLINHFIINDLWYLVDLPGYGYAKVSKSLRKDFEKHMKYYDAMTKEAIEDHWNFFAADDTPPPSLEIKPTNIYQGSGVFAKRDLSFNTDHTLGKFGGLIIESLDFYTTY